MEHKNLFDFGIEFNWKTASLLVMLAILPNLLGMINTTMFGVRIHFFQYLIFLAAIIYGPKGGAISGAFGSIYTAIAMNNPYIIVGNVILGAMVGIFARMDWNLVIAVLAAFAIQVPWLWVTDVYLAGMPIMAVSAIVLALFISNIIWALVAMKTYKPIRKAVI